MRTLLTGATGLLGKALLSKLEIATVLSRNPDRARNEFAASGGSIPEVYSWDPTAGPAPAEAVRGADVIFNLAGEPVGGRWTAEKKRRIYDSRVLGTRNLVSALTAASSIDAKPRVLVSASAVGYYGDCGDDELDESAPNGGDFLAGVCADWEREAMAARGPGLRVVCVRIGLVLAAKGGALGRMIGPFKMGVGGRLGDGKQWWPWIHVDDAIGILLHVSRKKELSGPVNAVSPNPVTNAEFTEVLGKAIRRPTICAMPKMALRIALGEFSDAVLFSQRAFPAAAKRSGYAFEHENLPSALASLV
ncbi:TIGR01777 family oxidoreductase [Pendulispora rubella]|uniref:TIGR01777 family oxidoreductase n=1 Tax=Pendulispora rubella TaxID=2741070 RepID=A0ABZ2LAU3_9BACT